ncbi:hypothetical protein L1987_84850 [Smallanthus sonchifolius]|uniref:Uncharacterized protein n=1 Tax=Smallanthus sonchifolius TaxID=185202 RepID=A0ACB8XVQ4_9ASTR|nr:hypothetical protein L1987_84850 [Smallanthus sonchifolius]
MNRRLRNRSAAVDGYLRYLKPGTLAQLRDRKINARTHYRSSVSQIYLSRAPPLSPASFSPSRSPNADASGQQEEAVGPTAVSDGESPCFSVRFYGPRCPHRKKLMAARSMFYSERSDGPAPVIDAFTNDFLVAQ